MRISAPGLRGCSLLRSIAQSNTRQLCSKTSLCSPKISLAPRSLKFIRGSNSRRCTYMTCLLPLEIFYKLISQRMSSLKEHVSLCGLVHALDSWRVVSERNWSEMEPSLWPLELWLYFARSALRLHALLMSLC